MPSSTGRSVEAPSRYTIIFDPNYFWGMDEDEFSATCPQLLLGLSVLVTWDNSYQEDLEW